MITDPLSLVNSILTDDKANPVKTIAGRGGIPIFRRELRAAVRGLWGGAMQRAQAKRVFNNAIEKAIDKAWIEGAAECGIQPDEMTTEELTKRDEFVFSQWSFVDGFLDDIQDRTKKKKGPLQPLIQRVELWVNGYNDAKNQSMATVCENFKAEWILGKTEIHCRSCFGFSGRVYRLERWRENGAIPQSSRLACNGFRCECFFRRTNKPITKGKFPSRLLS